VRLVHVAHWERSEVICFIAAFFCEFFFLHE
jgi:hypothetical protein